MRLRPALAILGLAALASTAAAQTTDPLFARWRWTPDTLGSRPAGMGGAFVAIADSVQAAYVNPAGLSYIPLTELNLASGEPWLAAGRGFGGLRLAAYVTRIDDQGVELGDGSGRGSMDGSVREAGLAFAVKPFGHVRVGASLAWSRLDLEGRRTVADGRGGETVAATVRSEGSQVRGTVGALIQLMGSRKRALPSLRLGLSYQPGFNRSARIAGSEGPRTIDIRRPTVVAAGLAWRPSDRWGFSAQGDVVRNREVLGALRRNVGEAAAAGFRLPDTIEPRIGGEFTAPLWCGCGGIKLRAGIHHQSPGTLRDEGADRAAAGAFDNRRWKTVTGVGGSFFTEHFGNAVRLDLDARDLFDGPDLSFGIVWRF